jgi:hypothetical protein
MLKINFIIWGYLDGPIRVEKTNTLLKTYTHRCEPAKGEGGNLVFGNKKSVIARLHAREAVAISKGDCFVASLLAMTISRSVIASPPKVGVANLIFKSIKAP